jgi:ribose 5-phosphate isomerase B
MIVAFANDHSGYQMRDEVLGILRELGVEIIDHGSRTKDRVDFPDLARLVCRSVLDKRAERGIMLCGTGLGAAIGANKFPGIRAGVCHDVYSAHQGVEHDNMSILCLGAKIIGPWLAGDIIKAFISARFSADEYFRDRDAKLARLEAEIVREWSSQDHAAG